MKKLNLILLVIMFSMLIGNSLYSQSNLEWFRNYYYALNDNKSKCIEVDNLGNTIVSGLVLGNGVDIVTLKYDSAGTFLWSKIYTNVNQYNSDDGVNDLTLDNQGNIYVTGYTATSVGTNRKFLTIKYNPSGDTLWVRMYQNLDNYSDEAKAISLDANGNVFITGYSNGPGTDKDYQTVKYDNNGNLQWAMRYNSSGNLTDIPNEMDVDIAGNVYVTGQSKNGNTNFFSYFTIKYNTNGNEIWTKYSGYLNANNIATSICVDKSQNVYVTGLISTGSGVDTAGRTYKYDANGNELWSKRFSQQQDRPIVKVVDEYDINDESNIIVASSNNLSYQVTGYDFHTIKYDGLNGDIIWNNGFNHTSNSFDNLNAMTVDSEGNVYVTGKSYDYTTNFDIATIKYDGITGKTLWYERYNAAGNIPDNVHDIAIGPKGTVHIAGEFNNGVNIIHLLKYSQTFVVPTLNLTCLLQGFYNSSLNRMLSDTVTVFLRNNSNPYNVVDSCVGILSASGKGVFEFPNATNGTPYYIIVKHRNSIETWCAAGETFSSNVINYDFTTNTGKAYGDNVIQIDASPVRFALYCGDVNIDGAIDLADLSLIDNDVSNVVTGYVQTDVNGDDIVDMTDASLADNNALNIVVTSNPILGSRSNEFQKTKSVSNLKNKFELLDNYPNPFNPSTVISYRLAENGFVSLKVYDISGREVMTLVNEFKTAGYYTVTFNGAGLSTGVYVYRVSADANGQSVSSEKKMVLVK